MTGPAAGPACQNTGPAAGPWGLTRVAFGCDSLDDINERMAIFAAGSGAARHGRISSRRVPRRDLSGGRIFWIIRHMLVARQSILGVDAASDDAGPIAIIRLGLDVVPVRPRPYRSHQGWRYMAHADWPADMDIPASGDALPPAMEAELMALKLV